MTMWPRFDPSLGLSLCSNCWNRGPQGLKHHCNRGMCDCPCTDMQPPKKVKFTGEGQTEIDVSDCITIARNS